MHNTVKRAFLLLLVVGVFAVGFVVLVFSFVQNGTEWVKSPLNAHLYSDGQPSSAGTVYDSDGAVLMQTKDGKRVFSDDYLVRLATLHAMGDMSSMSTGINNLYKGDLTGYDNLTSGVYNVKKYGIGNDINLSLDADVCKSALNALNGRHGTVGVYNYKTGEIVCMVSTPTYDPNNKPDEETMKTDAYKNAYYNKFLSLYFTPGSIFKTVTTACAIENIPDIYEKKFVCDGGYTVNGQTVKCTGVHGTQTIGQALTNSCNDAFAQIGVMLGREKLQKTAEKLGITSSFELDRTEIKAGKADLTNAYELDMALASIGQYDVRVNPCSMMTLMGAIANGGDAVKPYYVKNIISPDKSVVYSAKTEKLKTIDLSSSTAEKLKTMLRDNVVNKYGDYSFPNLQMCGKTGTAEVGGEDGKDYDNNAWFTGFSLREDFPYAVVVLVEKAEGFGSTVAIPIANTVLQSLISQ